MPVATMTAGTISLFMESSLDSLLFRNLSSDCFSHKTTPPASMASGYLPLPHHLHITTMLQCNIAGTWRWTHRLRRHVASVQLAVIGVWQTSESCHNCTQNGSEHFDPSGRT